MGTDPRGEFGTTATNSATLTSGTEQVSFNFNPSGTGLNATVKMHCDRGPASSGIQTIQQGVVRDSTLRATELISTVVNNGIDASYAGGGSGLDIAPGSVTTVTQLGENSSFWTGLRYDATIGTADQWTGGQFAGAAGVNWALSDAWVIGAFVGLEKSGFALTALDQTMGGGGYTVGLTGAYRAGDWRLKVVGYTSALSYDLNDAGTTATFGALRYVIDAKLVGKVALSDTVDFVPELGLAGVLENQDAYTDSASVAHAGQQILAARGTAGGKLVLYPDDSGIVVSAGAYADYWAGQSNSGLTGRVELGSTIDLGASATLSLNGGLNGIFGAQLGASADVGLKAAF